jgi:anti-anti-sigma factor
MPVAEQAANIQVMEDKLGLTVHILSDITISTSAEIAQAVIAAWEEKSKPRRVILDLHGVRHIDSSGVGALMEIQQRVTQAGGRLVLCGLEEGPRRLLDRTGIARLFEIREGVDDVRDFLPAGRRHRELASFDAAEDLQPRRRHRGLCALVWFCVIVGGLAGIGFAAYPTLQQYHAQLQQVPVLSGLVGAMDKRVAEMEQGIKDRFSGLEDRFNGHARAERRLHAEIARRAAEMNSRLDAVESAQRAADERIADLQRQLQEQQNGEKPQQ